LAGVLIGRLPQDQADLAKAAQKMKRNSNDRIEERVK
jgi:hypothetical protein